MNIYLIESANEIHSKLSKTVTQSYNKYEFFIKQKSQNSTLLSLVYNKTEFKFRNFGFSPNGKIICIIDENNKILLFNYEEGKLVGQIVIDLNIIKEIENFISLDKRNIFQKAFSRISFLDILNEDQNITISDDSRKLIFFSSKIDLYLENDSKIIIFIKNYIDDNKNIYGNWFELKTDSLVEFFNFNLNQQSVYSDSRLKRIALNNIINEPRLNDEKNFFQIQEINYKSNFSVKFFIQEHEIIDKIKLLSIYLSHNNEKYNSLIIIKTNIVFNSNSKDNLSTNTNPILEFISFEKYNLKSNNYSDTSEILTKLSTNYEFLCICITFKCKSTSYEIVVYDLGLRIFRSRTISLNDFSIKDTNLAATDIYFSDNQFILNFGFRYLIFYDCYSIDIIYISNDIGLFSPVFKVDLINEIKINKILFSWLSSNKDISNKRLYILNKDSQFQIKLKRKLENKKIINNLLDDEYKFLDRLSICLFLT